MCLASWDNIHDEARANGVGGAVVRNRLLEMYLQLDNSFYPMSIGAST